MDEYFTLVLTQLLAFVAALITAYVTYLLANKHWKQKLQYDKQKIAQGFIHELENLERTIVPLIKIHDEWGFTVGHPDVLFNAIEKTGVNLNKNNPLYDEHGLFFQFRKDIYDFERDTIDNILQFYKTILNANEKFKPYITDRYAVESLDLQGEFLDNIKKANSYLPELKESLGKYS
jgi:hypothetical protein